MRKGEILILLVILSMFVLSASVQAQGSRTFCSIIFEPIQPGQSQSTVNAAGCFDTFAKSVLFGTKGKIVLPADATPDAATIARIAASPDLTSLIGSDWLGANYTSSRYDYYGATGDGCDSGDSFGWTYMPSGWDNDVSSSIGGYDGCNNFIHYKDQNYGGTYIDCGGAGDTCPTMGSFDNTTSSERATP